MRPPTQAELAAYVGWVGSINPAPSQSPVASPAEGTWRSWVDGANPAYGHRTQSPACNQRPAASAVSSGCVLNAMAAPGAALWTALRTRSNSDRLLGGSLSPAPITTKSYRALASCLHGRASGREKVGQS